MTVTTQQGGGAMLDAAHWMEALIQGPLAVALAILAIAGAGLLMLSGRLAIRRGAAVVAGCFVLFGAPAIARGLFGSAQGIAGTEPASAMTEPTAPAPSLETPPSQPLEADPYAGASVSR